MSTRFIHFSCCFCYCYHGCRFGPAGTNRDPESAAPCSTQQSISPKDIPNSNNYMKKSTKVCRNDV